MLHLMSRMTISVDTCYGTAMYKHGINFLKRTGNETIQTRGHVT